MHLGHLTDQTLLSDAKKLAQKERHLTTQILWHLREIDRRKLYCDLQCASLWEYAIRELGYSEGTAHRRITAARALGQMPELEAKLNQGSLNLVALTMVMQEFKDETLSTKRAIIEEIENKSPQQVRQIIQEKMGKPKQKFMIEVDEETYELIHELKGLQPQEKDVVKSALVTAVNEAKKQRFKQVTNPRITSTVEVKRKVFARDKHRCSNCASKYALEIDHIKPKSLGGTDDISNLRVLCRNCNQRARMAAGLTRSAGQKVSQTHPPPST